MAVRKSIDQEFIESYNRQGLQPSAGGVSPIRNIQTQKRSDPTERTGGLTRTRNVNTPAQSVQAANTNATPASQPVQQTAKSTQVRSVVTEAHPTPIQPRQYRPALKVRKPVVSAVVGATLRRGVTIGIWGWAFWVWLWVQLPFAILSIMFMALTEALYQLYVSLTVSTAEDGLIVTALKYVGELTAKVLGSVFELVNAITIKYLGFDVDTLNPANVFMLTHTITMFIGWGTLFAIGILYLMSGQKAFSGQGAGGKNAMFVLALIGYTIPIFNLFPWFFLWTLLVLKNPR